MLLNDSYHAADFFIVSPPNALYYCLLTTSSCHCLIQKKKKKKLPLLNAFQQLACHHYIRNTTAEYHVLVISFPPKSHTTYFNIKQPKIYKISLGHYLFQLSLNYKHYLCYIQLTNIYSFLIFTPFFLSFHYLRK